MIPVWFASVSILLQGADARTVYADCQRYTGISREFYRKLQAEAPDSAFALTLKAEARRQREQFAEADDFARRAGVIPVPDCSRGRAACAYAGNRWDEAVTVGRAEGSPEALYWAALAAKQLAGAACQALAELPESVELHVLKAKDLQAAGKFKEAAAQWRAASRLAPGDRTLSKELAASLFLSEDWKAVLPELQLLLKASPDSANLNFFVGDSLLETEALPEALPYLEAAVRLDSHLLPAHVALGFCLSRLGQAKEAIPHLKAGLPLDHDGSIYYQLARAYGATHQTALAKQMMDRYAAIHRTASAPTSPAP